jgi:hypothetical protein
LYSLGDKIIKNIEYKFFQVFLLLIIFLQSSNVAAATVPVEQWNRSFGGDGEYIARCVQQTLEGGYVIAGTTILYGKGMEGYHDAWLIKVDKNGNMQWNKTFLRIYAGLRYFIRQTPDGGYVLASSLVPSDYSFLPGYTDPWLIKIDKNGNEIWKKEDNEITHEDYLQYRAERTSDGGYIIGDTVWHEIGGYNDLIDNDIRLTKYDIQGNQQWNSTFGQKNSSEIIDPLLGSVKQAPDGGYVIASSINLKETNTNSDIWLIKTNENGQEQWNRTYGGPLDDSAFYISITSDNGYVLAGKYTESCSYGKDGSAFILKTDSKGNQKWIKIFSNCTLYSVQQTSDDGYIAAGVKNGNAWLVKLVDDKGSIEYENIRDYSSSQIKNSTYNIFYWIFHWGSVAKIHSKNSLEKEGKQ